MAKKVNMKSLKLRIIRKKLLWEDSAEFLWWIRKKTWKEILEKIPKNWLCWLLFNGFSEFIDSPNISKLDSYNWYGLLLFQPQFAKYCDWNKLDGCSWSSLLCHQPQFAEYCDWNKLDSVDWIWLLRKQPQFAEYCDWEKLDIMPNFYFGSSVGRNK